MLRSYFKSHTDVYKTIANELVARIVGLITTLLLARSLDVDDFGRWSYLQSFLLYFIVLAEFGSNQDGVRNLIRSRSKRSNFNKEFDLVIKNKSFGATVSAVLILIFFALGVLSLTEFFALLLCILAYLISKDWYLRAISMQVLASCQNSVHLVLLLVFVSLSLYFDSISLLTPESLTAVKGVGFAIVGVVVVYKHLDTRRIVNFFSLPSKVPSKNVVFLVLGSLLAKVYFSSDVILIELNLNSHAVGMYSAIAVFYASFIAFRGVVIGALYPKMCSISSLMEFKTRAIKISTFFGLFLLPVMLVASYFNGELITMLLGERYLNEEIKDIYSVFILVCIILSFGLLYPNSLHVLGESQTFFIITLLAALINVVGNLMFLEQGGIIVAAYTTLVAESFIVSVSFILFLIKCKRDVL